MNNDRKDNEIENFKKRKLKFKKAIELLEQEKFLIKKKEKKKKKKLKI